MKKDEERRKEIHKRLSELEKEQTELCKELRDIIARQIVREDNDF